ncbi:CopG family transcriptional regulator [Thiospirochaeta perfilievii]|uniref:CopG family transcriptional regulator n=1 Tax=Thiospirochaeta perfilievii TaxID=252967 RepID=A0A5C1QDX2_9SPIO|nr:TM1266 family iron-only hydrogenase system putative regulator [Thiospirochaeta perfilievii]QEN05568.1 CopG family transcriptional regulator [Thiospirochaeta perfilievii]
MSRYGFVGITINTEITTGIEVQKILTTYSHIIMGRMGIPAVEDGSISVITLIVKTTTDELGALTGKLGRLNGVNVKSGLCKV